MKPNAKRVADLERMASHLVAMVDQDDSMTPQTAKVALGAQLGIVPFEAHYGLSYAKAMGMVELHKDRTLHLPLNTGGDLDD